MNGTYYEPKYTAYLKCGTGIKHFSVYRNGTYVSMNQSTSYTPVELTESKKQITINSKFDDFYSKRILSISRNNKNKSIKSKYTRGNKTFIK